MKVTKHKANEERRILIGMVVDEVVLGRIDTKWSGDMFRSRWANIIAGLCLRYYKKYGKAPMKHIETLFNRWAQKGHDENTVELVEKFLASLSNEYETLKDESNTDYVIDLAGQYFNKVQLERLLEAAQDDIDDDKVTEAHDRVASYNRIDLGVGQGIDVFQDVTAIQKAFESKKKPLVPYRKDLGEFFGDAFCRGNFVSFLGPEKRGKSFWLADVAFRAMKNRKRVALFEAGDMGEDATIRRLMVRCAERPMKAGEVRLPNKIRFREDAPVKIKGSKQTFEKGLTWKQASKAARRIMKRNVHSKKSFFKLSTHPNSTLSVSGIESIIRDWGIEGWTPDVVVIDYADILNMTYKGLEGRDCINMTWKQLRALSQKLHCLVVTATQADAASYGKGLVTMSNFSEDKRKLSHVTGMIGINCTREEKAVGLMRLNWVALREGSYLESRCVYVAGCLALANPAIISSFRTRRKV